MRTAGIVAEYNPFHFGHLYQLNECRKQMGVEAPVFAVMSGDYVQRGEPAFFDKFSRAGAACANGVNAVFELPLPWCCATAEIFAAGAVLELAALGVTDLFFGSENGDAAVLEKTADILLSPEFGGRLNKKLETERSLPYAAAREQVLMSMDGTEGILSMPNNILAVEYIKAIKRFEIDMDIHAIARVGSGHDSSEASGEFLSAKEIRRRLRGGDKPESLLPAASERIFARELEKDRYCSADDRLMLSRLLSLSKSECENFAYCSGGLGNAVYEAVHSCRSVEEITEKLTGKTFTRARVRRALTACCLGNTVEPSDRGPGYARLLAADAAGRRALKERRGATDIPVITKAADIRKSGVENTSVFSLCASAHDFYMLCMESRESYVPDEDWSRGPVLL